MRRDRDRARRAWAPPTEHELDRNGEPCESDPWEGNLVLYVVVLGALSVIIGAELLLLGIMIGR